MRLISPQPNVNRVVVVNGGLQIANALSLKSSHPLDLPDIDLSFGSNWVIWARKVILITLKQYSKLLRSCYDPDHTRKLQIDIVKFQYVWMGGGQYASAELSYLEAENIDNQTPSNIGDWVLVTVLG